MKSITVPTREEVSTNNQAIFDNLKAGVGFVPNLYAYFAKSETALGDYLDLSGRKSTLTNKEKEVVNLITSQINACRYCQSAHTAIGKMNGFTDDQILEIRKGSISFDSKLDSLVKFAASVVKNKGNADESLKQRFFDAGYDESSLVDVVMLVGDKTITNYLYKLADFEIDFPLAKEI